MNEPMNERMNEIIYLLVHWAKNTWDNYMYAQVCDVYPARFLFHLLALQYITNISCLLKWLNRELLTEEKVCNLLIYMAIYI